MKLKTKTTAGIRTGCFSNTVLFLKEAVNLEIAHYDQETEFAQFKLPSGQILEVLDRRVFGIVSQRPRIGKSSSRTFKIGRRKLPIEWMAQEAVLRTIQIPEELKSIR